MFRGAILGVKHQTLSKTAHWYKCHIIRTIIISTPSNAAWKWERLKMRIPKRNPKHDEKFQNRPELTQILHFSPAEPIVAPPTQPPAAGPSAPQIRPILRKEKLSIQFSVTSDSYTSSVRRCKRQLKKQKRISYQQTQSIIHYIQDTHGYSIELSVFHTTYIRLLYNRWIKTNFLISFHYNTNQFLQHGEMSCGLDLCH